MERKVTFLLGTGRCGSTLAQRLLNASPQALIWGEHEGFLEPIARAYFRVLQSKNLDQAVFQQPGRFSISRIVNNKEAISQSNISWMNDFDQSSLKLNFREFIESIFCSRLPPSISCWGFKEIRYGGYSNDPSLDMLIELFPESRNLIITRHPFDTVISMITAWNSNLVDTSKDNKNIDKLRELAQTYLRKWSAQNQKLLDYVHRFPDNFMWIRYEDFSNKFDDTVFNFIGIESPESLEQILDHKVWQTKKSPKADTIRQHLRPVQTDVWKIVEATASELGYEPYEI